jgi:hypothetical protein
MTETQLIALIREAFKNSEKPSDKQIVSDDPDPEALDLAKQLRQRDWQDIKEHDLDSSPNIALLTPKAYRYFLPGFLLAQLAYGEGKFFACRNLVLSPIPGWPESCAIHRQMISALTDSEQRAVKEYVKYAVESGDETAALAWRDYWSKY